MGKKRKCTCGRKARMFKPWEGWPWSGGKSRCSDCGRKLKNSIHEFGTTLPAPMVVGTVRNLVPSFDSLQQELDRVLSLYVSRKDMSMAVQLPPLCTVCHVQRARPNSTVICEGCAEDLAKSPDALIDVLESLGYTVGSVNDEDDYKGADHADSRG